MLKVQQIMTIQSYNTCPKITYNSFKIMMAAVPLWSFTVMTDHRDTAVPWTFLPSSHSTGPHSTLACSPHAHHLVHLSSESHVREGQQTIWPWAMQRQPKHGCHFVSPVCGRGQNGSRQTILFCCLNEVCTVLQKHLNAPESFYGTVQILLRQNTKQLVPRLCDSDLKVTTIFGVEQMVITSLSLLCSQEWSAPFCCLNEIYITVHKFLKAA